MRTIGVRELWQKASELVRQVRVQGNSIQITYYCKVVALRMPVKPNNQSETETQRQRAAYRVRLISPDVSGDNFL